MILVVPQIVICFLVTNRLAKLTHRHSIAVLFESAVRSAMASLRATGHEHAYHCPARQSFATFPSRHDPSPLNVNNNTRSFATPTAGPRTRPLCGEIPQQQQAHLTSSSELPTYTVAGQQPHDAAPEALCSSFPAPRQETASGLAKGVCVPTAQEFGYFTSVCHRSRNSCSYSTLSPSQRLE